MRKLWAIIWKENYERFTDRTGALFMFLTPLALAFVIGLAFSGLGGDDVALHVPVGIVNLDEGSDQGSFGEVFVQAMVPADPANPDPDNELFDLFDATAYEDEAEARALVESGELSAALIIPPDFSQSLALDPAAYVELATGGEDVLLTGQASLTLYYNSGSQLGWTVLRDVAQGIANGIATGNIAINTTVSGLLQANPLLGIQLAGGAFDDLFADIAMTASDPEASPIQLAQLDIEGESASFDPMSFFGPGIAIFFAGFTVTLGAASVLQERRDWTLQRMITTPTARNTILAGKMLGTYIGGVLQMAVLIVAMTAVNSLLQGEFASVYGEDLLGIILVTLATVAAGTGIGVLIAGSARTFEQATNTGTVIMIVMGLLGGVFFAPPPGLEFASQLTFHYWGSNAFSALATGSTLVDVLPNIGALLIMAAILFGLGLWQFNRQLSL